MFRPPGRQEHLKRRGAELSPRAGRAGRKGVRIGCEPGSGSCEFRKKPLERRASLPIHCRPVPWDGVRTAGVGYPSGQRGQTVNLLAYAFTGSNPVPTTTCAGSEVWTAWRLTYRFRILTLPRLGKAARVPRPTPPLRRANRGVGVRAADTNCTTRSANSAVPAAITS
ncbi:MAG: hypothetical protein RIS76_4479 [Verrucomicrobiota bacterium]